MVILSTVSNEENSLKIGLQGFYAVAALSSVYGILCTSSLIFFSF